VLVRHRAPGKARARAACDDGYARGVTLLQNCNHLRLVLWNRDSRGHGAIDREAIALVRSRVLGRGQERRWRQESRELRVHVAVEHGSGNLSATRLVGCSKAIISQRRRRPRSMTL